MKLFASRGFKRRFHKVCSAPEAYPETMKAMQPGVHAFNDPASVYDEVVYGFIGSRRGLSDMRVHGIRVR